MDAVIESINDLSSFFKRFGEKIEKQPNGCWLWTGCKKKNGYGMLNVGGRPRHAHRVSYLLFKGEIPTGLVVDHMCKVKSCVNPVHLRAITNRENCWPGSGLTLAEWASKS